LKLKIGKIPYLNSVLFYHGLESGRTPKGHDIELMPLVPRQLSGAAVEDIVDAGPVPLVTCWDIEDRFEQLDDFCIATVREAHSILLFSKRPFDELTDARIGVTNETSTSVRLMKVLMGHVYKVRPAEYVRLDWPRNDAFLLIGDEALLHRRGVDSYPHTADLGRVWNDWTGLPFVFAKWVVRRDLNADAKAALTDALGESLESGWKNVGAVVAPYAKTLGMTEAEMREYLEGFRFRMTAQERDAIERFKQVDAEARGAGAASTTG
jgi:chorismate dehydratase